MSDILTPGELAEIKQESGYDSTVAALLRHIDALQAENERLVARSVMRWLNEKPESESFDEGYQAATAIIKGLGEMRYKKLKEQGQDDETIVKDMLALHEALMSWVNGYNDLLCKLVACEAERDALAAKVAEVREIVCRLQPARMISLETVARARSNSDLLQRASGAKLCRPHWKRFSTPRHGVDAPTS